MLSKSPWRKNASQDDEEVAHKSLSKSSHNIGTSDGSDSYEKSRVSRACQRIKSIFSSRNSSHEDQRENIKKNTECLQSKNQPSISRTTSATALVTEYIRGVTRSGVVVKKNCASNTPSVSTTLLGRRPSEPKIFLVGQGSFRERHALLEKCRACRIELVGVACLLVELKKHLSDDPWRSENESDRALKTAFKVKNKSNYIETCDKGVQCSVGNEFLKISPDVKFFSRSSLVINVDQKQQQQQKSAKQPLEQFKRITPRVNDKLLPSPSLEYVASYRPEFQQPINVKRLPGLRSFSSSAIFGLETSNRGDSSKRLRSTCAPNPRNRGTRNIRQQKSRRFQRSFQATNNSNSADGGGGGGGNSDRELNFRESLRRTEDELLRYSNFIENDLVSLPRPRTQPSSTQASRYSSPHKPSKRRPQTRSGSENRLLPNEDILAVKKILLEDYITEVREIVRSRQHYNDHEQRSDEVAILKNVRRRMDEEPTTGSKLIDGQPMSDESWHSLNEMKNQELLHQQQRPSTSGATSTTYVTASNCCSSYSCCWCCCDCRFCQLMTRSNVVRPSQDSGDFCRNGVSEKLGEREREFSEKGGDGRQRFERCYDSFIEGEPINRLVNSENESKAKTSRSIDSGVQLDYSRAASSLHSTEELQKFDTGRVRRRNCSTATTTGDESSGCSDEILCQRVESAVRKFTEKLILCERRTNDRSSSAGRRRPAQRKIDSIPHDDFIVKGCPYKEAVHPVSSHPPSQGKQLKLVWDQLFDTQKAVIDIERQNWTKTTEKLTRKVPKSELKVAEKKRIQATERKPSSKKNNNNNKKGKVSEEEQASVHLSGTENGEEEQPQRPRLRLKLEGPTKILVPL
ncbi:hypothetical protein QAD02_001385 [Eretmocerus hayati]|uniref:Uncharacterized protein n=1 Tax=Eretmocerus hayati TaxID=131215 RepID=A0ACC2NGT1_9HYME|nr:hypothetical protein QAD02_001385 [Eretmocerus hayati]